MSKTLNKLSDIQERRSNTTSGYPAPKYGTFSVKAISKLFKGKCPARISNTWILGLAIAIMLFAILAISARTFNKVRLNDFERNELSARVGKMQEQINSNNAVIEKLTDILDRVTLKIKDTNTKITELEKDKDSQSFAIENLTKAKNALLNRINKIESQ